MTFKAYWARLLASNPTMRDETAKATLTVASLKKQLEKAYDAGFSDGVSMANGIEESERSTADTSWVSQLFPWVKD